MTSERVTKDFLQFPPHTPRSYISGPIGLLPSPPMIMFVRIYLHIYSEKLKTQAFLSAPVPQLFPFICCSYGGQILTQKLTFLEVAEQAA